MLLGTSSGNRTSAEEERNRTRRAGGRSHGLSRGTVFGVRDGWIGSPGVNDVDVLFSKDCGDVEHLRTERAPGQSNLNMGPILSYIHVYIRANDLRRTH